MQTTAEGIFAPRWRRPALALAAASAALLAAAAGYYVARGPAWVAALDTFGPLHLFALAAGLLTLLFILMNPEAGLLLLTVVLYTNLSEVAVRNYGVPSLLQALALTVAAGLVLRWLSSAEWARARVVADPLLVPLIAYVAVVLASSLWAADAALADERLAENFKGLGVFLLVTNLVTTRRTLRRVVWALVLSGAFLGTVSVLQVLTHSYGSEFGGFGRIKIAHIAGSTHEPRIAGPLSDPNFYAQILVALVPLALHRLWDERSLRLRLVAAYALGVITLAAVFTYSRGGALALGLVLLLAGLYKRVRVKHVLAGLLALAPFALLVPGSFERRLGTLSQFLHEDEEVVTSEPVETSIRQRTLMMTAAWEMFKDRPLSGVGAGNYDANYDEYTARLGSTLNSYENFGQQHFPHSLYLEVAAETGLAGLLTLVAALLGALLSLRSAHRLFRDAGEWRAASAAVSLALALVGYLTTSLILHGHYVRYLWLLLAVAAAARQVARRGAAEEVHA
ncbi:MAG TPA: O-antigen ligase family protein [Pyrinomonadaceae bacterium]